MGYLEGISMKKHLTPEGFDAVVLRLTQRMQEAVELMNQAVIAGDSRTEAEHRTLLRAYDLALFTINLNSSVIDEKETA